MLLTALAFVLNTPVLAPKPISASNDPPIRVWLNDNNYQIGDRASVKIRLADDGYVVVLRADANGHLRILFPLDPGTDNFVKGGKTFEVRGRGDRDAFQVDDQNGSGTIFAAVSAQPFTFSGFVLGDHWDYKVLGSQDLGSDPEGAMVDLVHNLAGQNHFDYDVTTYTVSSQVASSGGDYYAPAYPTYYPCWGCGPWYPGAGVFINFRFGARYGFYNSCFYDPFFCDGFGIGYNTFYGGYGYGFYRPFPRYGITAGFYRPFAPAYRPPFGVPRTTVMTTVGVRNRFAPSGPGPVARGGRGPVPAGSFQPSRGRGGNAPASGARPERGSRPAPTARPSSPPPDRGRGQPEPRRGRGNNMEAPRMQSRPSMPSFHSAPAPRSGGGGGGGGGHGRHGR